MKLLCRSGHRHPSGHALVIVLVFLVVGLVVLGSTMGWLSTNARLIERNQEYFRTVAAAEAATEKVISTMSHDYQKKGAAEVALRMSAYPSSIPLAQEHPDMAAYAFTGQNGEADQAALVQLSPWAISPLISQYRGLSGFASTYRVVANARSLTSRQSVAAAVQQDFQIATIPLFQFAIFYNIDLEINPGPQMTVSGRVHSNKDFYAQPQNVLTFNGDVTSAGSIFHDKAPGDPSNRSGGSIIYGGEHDSGVNTLNLPLGVENTPDNVRGILAMPPAGESITSPMGEQRFFNKSDLTIEVYDDHVVARSGPSVPLTVTLAPAAVSGFLRTNVSFFNKREGKTVRATQIDVGQLRAWNAAGNPIKSALGRDVNSIYIADLRTQSIDTQPGVKVVNGQTLPNAGLTISTPDPLYVHGHYNVPSADLGTSNTQNTRPAAFLADAITVLSGSWTDGNSTAGLSSRRASDTTVNAAFLAGIVPTTDGSYSGGVENFPRFLEDWGNRTLTYNGSMIVMFPSAIATGTWKGTGGAYGIYNPPRRNWAFDLSFLNPGRLPPGTPEIRAVIRGQWSMAAPSPN